MTKKQLAALQDALAEWDKEEGVHIEIAAPMLKTNTTPTNKPVVEATFVEELDPLEQRIAVVGGGAMGSLFSSLLSVGAERLRSQTQGVGVGAADMDFENVNSNSNSNAASSNQNQSQSQSQADVCLLTSWKDHADAIRAAGGISLDLDLDLDDQPAHASTFANVVPCSSVDSVTKIWRSGSGSGSGSGSSCDVTSSSETADIVLVLTKSDKTAEAASAAAELIKDNEAATVITLQNGFTNLDALKVRSVPLTDLWSDFPGRISISINHVLILTTQLGMHRKEQQRQTTLSIVLTLSVSTLLAISTLLVCVPRNRKLATSERWLA